MFSFAPTRNHNPKHLSIAIVSTVRCLLLVPLLALLSSCTHYQPPDEIVQVRKESLKKEPGQTRRISDQITDYSSLIRNNYFCSPDCRFRMQLPRLTTGKIEVYTGELPEEKSTDVRFLDYNYPRVESARAIKGRIWHAAVISTQGMNVQSFEEIKSTFAKAFQHMKADYRLTAITQSGENGLDISVIDRVPGRFFPYGPPVVFTSAEKKRGLGTTVGVSRIFSKDGTFYELITISTAPDGLSPDDIHKFGEEEMRRFAAGLDFSAPCRP